MYRFNIESDVIMPQARIDHTEKRNWQRGVIKLFKDDKGFGFISREGEPDLFFHASRCRPLVITGFQLGMGVCEQEIISVEVPVRYDPIFEIEWSDDFRPEEFMDYESMPATPTTRIIELPKTKMVNKLVNSLPQLASKGRNIWFVAGEFKSKQCADWWTFDDVLEKRGELNAAYDTHLNVIEAMPIYRLERTEWEKGPSVADNVRKMFVHKMIPHQSVIFSGNNVNRMSDIYMCSVNRDRSISREIEYNCFQFTADQLVPCKLPWQQ